MESPDLNSASNPDGRFEAWLRQPGAALPDDGFSARVMRTLPPPVRRGNAFRVVICAAAAAIGIILAWPSPDAWRDVSFQVENWTTTFTVLGTALTDPMTLAALATAGLSLLVVFWRNDRALR